MKVIGVVFKILLGMTLCLSMTIVMAIMLFFLKVILDEIFEGDIETIVRWIRNGNFEDIRKGKRG